MMSRRSNRIRPNSIGIFDQDYFRPIWLAFPTRTQQLLFKSTKMEGTTPPCHARTLRRHCHNSPHPHNSQHCHHTDDNLLIHPRHVQKNQVIDYYFVYFLPLQKKMSLYLLTYFIIILLLLFIPTFPSHRLNIKPILHFVANLHRGELICLPKWSHTVHLFLYYYYVRTYLTIGGDNSYP